MKRTDLKNELICSGIRPSVQRLAIYEYVKESKMHPTAEVVYEALRDELGSLSLTTVYNTLKIFVDAGLVSMLNIDNAFHCFDGDTSVHAHFRCNICGQIHDMPMKEDYSSLVYGAENYQIKEAQLYLKGICNRCK